MLLLQLDLLHEVNGLPHLRTQCNATLQTVALAALTQCKAPLGNQARTCRQTTSACSALASATGDGMCSARVPVSLSFTFFSRALSPATFQLRMRKEGCSAAGGRML